MATDQEIQAKRASVDKLRGEIAAARTAAVSREDDANRQHQLNKLTSEEASLKGQLSSLKGGSPAPAPAPATPAPSTKAAAEADNKE